MYLCTGGAVTVGVGHAIRDVAEAVELKWSMTGRAATADEIRADHERVASAQKGMVAAWYAALTRCLLSDGDIDALLAHDMESFTAQLAQALPNWGKYPEPAQQAFFDMGFNLGIAGLKKFHRLLAAVDAGQWTAASVECHRQGISEERNRQIADLFRQAAVK
jgi:GH24 family phage-related lysozyme (muramidase)